MDLHEHCTKKISHNLSDIERVNEFVCEPRNENTVSSRMEGEEIMASVRFLVVLLGGSDGCDTSEWLNTISSEKNI